MKNSKIVANFLGIIPARAGSTGIPHKNLQKLAGKSLIEIAVTEALQSKKLDSLVVSSDSPEILNIAENLNAKTQNRPLALAKETTAMAETLLFVIDSFQKQQNASFEYFVILMPTAPFRKAEDIDAAIEYFLEKKAKALISVQPVSSGMYKNLFLDKRGFLQGLRDNAAPFINRQDCPPVFKANGFIFIFPVKDFLSEKHFPLKDAIPYFSEKEKCLDIDTPEDLEHVRNILHPS